MTYSLASNRRPGTLKSSDKQIFVSNQLKTNFESINTKTYSKVKPLIDGQNERIVDN